MRTDQPPALATRLLVRAMPDEGPDTNYDTLVGDLIEEYRHGRSSTWYWWQVVATIVLVSGQHVRKHPFLMIRATLIGFGSLLALSTLVQLVMTGVFLAMNGTHVGSHQVQLPRSWQPPLVQFLSLALPVVSLAGVSASGWLVARLHRAHGMTLVVAYARIFFLVLLVAWVWQVLAHSMRPWQAAYGLALYACFPGLVLLGGIVGARGVPRPHGETTSRS